MDRTTVAVVSLVVIAFLGLFSSLAYVTVSKQNAMVEMVAKGANPIAVHCAMDGVNNSNQAVCQALAAQVAAIQNK